MTGNLPDPVTDKMVSDAGESKQPTDEQIHKHVCENWRSLLYGDKAFISAEVDDCCDTSLEQTYVLLTVSVPVPWADAEA